MPAPSGFMTALGQMFQGYAQDQKTRDLNSDRDDARQNALDAKQAAQEARQREDALKGIRQGTAPNQSLITDASLLAASIAGGAAPIGLQGAMQDNPDQFAANRFQQVTPSSYLDRTLTPEAVAARKQDIAARLQEKRDQMRNDFTAKQQQAHEVFMQRQAQAASAAADARQQRALDSQPLAIEETLPDGTKHTRYVSKADAIKMGAAPPPKAAGAGSAQSAMALQRLGMSAGDVESAIGRQEAKENDPAFIAKLTAAQQAMGSASQVVPDDHAHGAMGVLSNAAGSFMSSAARGHMDPEVQEYMRDGQLTGLAFTEALPRPNQALLGMEKGLSLLGAGGATDAIRKDVQARRRMGLEQLHNAIGVLQPPTTVGQPNMAPLEHAPSAPAAPASLPPLSVTDRARANSNPAFKSWLVSQGYKL